MTGKSFNWDKYFSTSKWDDIRKNSPFFDGQRLPSLVNNDADLVYLSSLDLDFSLSNSAELESALVDVKLIFKRSLKSRNYYKAAIAETDFNFIKNILSNLGTQNYESLDR